MASTFSLVAADSLPFWRRPITLLFAGAAVMPVVFATWSAQLNCFMIDVA